MERDELLEAIRTLNNKLEVSQQTQTTGSGILETIVTKFNDFDNKLGSVDGKVNIMDNLLLSNIKKTDQVYDEMFIGKNGSAKSKIDTMMGKWQAVTKWCAAVIGALSLVVIAAAWQTYNLTNTNYRLLEEAKIKIEKIEADQKSDPTIPSSSTTIDAGTTQKPQVKPLKKPTKSVLLKEYHANDMLPIIALLMSDKERN